MGGKGFFETIQLVLHILQFQNDEFECTFGEYFIDHKY